VVPSLIVCSPLAETKGAPMPLIQIKVLEGALSTEQKNEMMSKISHVVAEIEARPYPKEKLLPHTWCIIEEIPPAKWGLGGQPLSLETLKALLSG
jgi:4-oxalocrotonate tautomerase